MKTNTGLVEFAKKAKAENWGYVLGTFGDVLTEQLLRAKQNQGGPNGRVALYNKKHNNYIRRFMGKRVTDCYGLVKAYVWWIGDHANPSYNYRGKTDRNQEMAFNAAKEKGPLSNMPEIPGLVLWMKGHAGVYIGNGEFIECAGAPKGMVQGKIVNGKVTEGSRFTHWFKDTYITYEAPRVEKVKLNLRGKPLEYEGYLENGTNYVIINGKKEVLRDYLEGLGLVVSWDQGKQTVNAI